MWNAESGYHEMAQYVFSSLRGGCATVLRMNSECDRCTKSAWKTIMEEGC